MKDKYIDCIIIILDYYYLFITVGHIIMIDYRWF